MLPEKPPLPRFSPLTAAHAGDDRARHVAEGVVPLQATIAELAPLDLQVATRRCAGAQLENGGRTKVLIAQERTLVQTVMGGTKMVMGKGYGGFWISKIG